MKRLFFLLLFSLFSWPLLAEQGRYEIETAYFHDEQKIHTLESIQAQAFKPYVGQLRLGFIKGETWIRIRLKNQPADAFAALSSHKVLRVGPYHLIDSLDFYHQNLENWTQQRGGRLQIQQKNVCIEQLNCFEWVGSTNVGELTYLKLDGTGARIVRTDVVAADHAFESSLGMVRSTNTALTLSIALLILSLTFLFFERTSLMLVFCFFQTGIVFSISVYSGFLHQWQWLMTVVDPNMLAGLALVMRVTMAVLLAWTVICVYKPSGAFTTCVTALLCVCGGNVLLVFAGYKTEASLLNYMLGFFSPIVFIWGAQTVREPMPGRWIFTAGWVTFLSFVVLGFPYNFGQVDWRDQLNLVQSHSDLRLNGIPIGIVVFWLVATEKASRNREKYANLKALEIQAAESKVHELGLKERRDLIDMLTHELKTPLSTIKFAMASLQRVAMVQGESLERVLHINASVDRMDAMIEHVALSNKIERMAACGSEETVSALELMNVVMQEYQAAERFELDIQEGVVFCAAPHFLALIIENLVSNAVKYSVDGQVKISIREEAAKVTSFRISNRVAEGHDPDEARLFERYYRHPNFQNSPGMGIGLSLVHSAAKKMGAEVLYQKVDQEAVFEVRFPR